LNLSENDIIRALNYRLTYLREGSNANKRIKFDLLFPKILYVKWFIKTMNL